mgnify:CR=1 FL=1
MKESRHLSYLTCSIYTLYGNHEFFKNFNLKDDVYVDREKSNHWFASTKNSHEFYRLTNKMSIKQFAFKLIKPLLKKNSESLNFYPRDNGGIDDEIILLKKYLRKFNFIYRRHFTYQNRHYIKLPSDKEINMHAIKTLFLLAGI